MLLILTGKTASGKDTIKSALLQKFPNFRKVITTTSRPPRHNEQNGLDYHFLTKTEFEKKIEEDEFLEYVEYGGNFYGTEKSRINPSYDLIWKIDPSMAGKAKRIFPDCLSLYITVDDQTVLQRLKKRGLSEAEIEKRMTDDKKFWDLYKSSYDYVVENIPGKLDETVEKIINILQTHVLQ